MRIAKLLALILLSATPVLAQPQITANVDFQYDLTAPGEGVGSVDVFYDQLTPYGLWVEEPRLGRVFIPERDDYAPYTEGHWQQTNLGFVWVSNEPFAWATTHYGRWSFSPVYSRWVWMPDTEWGPSWVEWRQTGSEFGWAPLAPDIVDIGYQPPVTVWHYVPAERVCDVNVVRYYEPRERVVTIHQTARPIERRVVGTRRVALGPTATELREHRVIVKPVKVEAKVVGRMTATEARTAVTRAHQRREQDAAENQKRIESKPKLREVHQKVATQKQPQQTTKPTAPTPAQQQDRDRDRTPPAQRTAPTPAPKQPDRDRTPPRATPKQPDRDRTPPRTEPQRTAPARKEPDRDRTPPRTEPQRTAPAPKEPPRADRDRKPPEREKPAPKQPDDRPKKPDTKPDQKDKD